MLEVVTGSSAGIGGRASAVLAGNIGGTQVVYRHNFNDSRRRYIGGGREGFIGLERQGGVSNGGSWYRRLQLKIACYR